MIRKDIISTIIKSVGHTGSVLEVEFNNGQIYTYSGVPAKEYDNLIDSQSPGKYFIQSIKSNYEYQKA